MVVHRWFSKFSPIWQLDFSLYRLYGSLHKITVERLICWEWKLNSRSACKMKGLVQSKPQFSSYIIALWFKTIQWYILLESILFTAQHSQNGLIFVSFGNYLRFFLYSRYILNSIASFNTIYSIFWILSLSILFYLSTQCSLLTFWSILTVTIGISWILLSAYCTYPQDQSKIRSFWQQILYVFYSASISIHFFF